MFRQQKGVFGDQRELSRNCQGTSFNVYGGIMKKGGSAITRTITVKESSKENKTSHLQQSLQHHSQRLLKAPQPQPTTILDSISSSSLELVASKRPSKAYIEAVAPKIEKPVYFDKDIRTTIFKGKTAN